MTAHTGDLDHALADALHAADVVVFHTRVGAAPGMEFNVTAWSGPSQFMAMASTPGEALTRAMRLLRAAKGEGGLQIVDFAAIEITGGAA